jgi:phosphopantothenoylcysteine decarboxylase
MTDAEPNSYVGLPAAARRVLLALTGSVASIKALELFQAFESEGWDVKVVATEAALHFVHTVLPTESSAPQGSSTDLSSAGPSNAELEGRFRSALHTDADEWAWKGRGDPVLHIELRKWADVLVIAPLDANTLAKLANGLSDNLLTCIVRAWEFSASVAATNLHPPTINGRGSGTADPASTRRSVCKPIVLAPAMNTAMWDHPFTLKHLQTVVDIYGGGCASVEGTGWDGSGLNGIIKGKEEAGGSACRLTIVSPVAKVLACGDVGVGAMGATQTIVAAIKKALRQSLIACVSF